MRITKETPALSKKSCPPILKWQVDDYSGVQEFRFYLPYAFLLLCKLWNVTPDDLLSDFMDNLSCGSWKREGRETAKKHLTDYAVAMGYGQHHYTREDINQLFAELDAIGLVWPKDAKARMIEKHARWRDDYYNWGIRNGGRS